MKKIHKIQDKIDCIYDNYHLNHFCKAYDFILSFYIPKTSKKKQTVVDLRTNFKDENTKKAFYEIANFKEVLKEQLKEKKA